MELKPCAYCGKKARIWKRTNGWDGYSYRVFCSNIKDCGATQYWFDTEEEAIEAWNRRVGEGEKE